MQKPATLVRAHPTLTSCGLLHYDYVTKYMPTCLVLILLFSKIFPFRINFETLFAQLFNPMGIFNNQNARMIFKFSIFVGRILKKRLLTA